MPNLPTTLPTGRHRRGGSHRVPGWWPRPRRVRGCIARIAPAVAAALCVFALVLLAAGVIA